VPIKSVDKREAKKTKVEVQGDVILHTVQKKETLFSISKNYGVTVNDLLELNPKASETLSTGAVLKIPSVKSTQVSEKFLEPAANDSFMVHQVASGETLYSISKQYNIPEDSLINANTNADLGIRSGQYLIIPVYNEEFLAAADQKKQKRLLDEMEVPNGRPDVFEIALLLPFELELNDSLERALMQGEDLYILTEISLEYYRGTIIALDSLSKLGLNANLYVYDVGEDIVKTSEAIKTAGLEDVDMIFGPMHKASLAMVSELSLENKVYLVSPNSFSNEVFEDNPYLLRGASSRETLVRYLANFIAINHHDHNVVMLNSESPRGWPIRKEFVKSYNLAASTFVNSFSDSLRSVTKVMFGSDGEPGEIERFLVKDTLNVLVVPSNDLAFVSDMMTRISLLSNEYDIQVYGLDKWINYENIEADYKNKLKLRLVVPGFVDYEDEGTLNFIKKYRKEYGSEPSHYDYGFKGYDLTMFFGLSLLKEGLGFPLSFDNLKFTGTSGSYRFGRSVTGKEFENKEAYIIQYDDYQIKRVN
jgi:LysM repeat protein